MILRRTFLFRWIGAIFVASLLSFILISQRYSPDYQEYYPRIRPSKQQSYRECTNMVENYADITLNDVWEEMMNRSRTPKLLGLAGQSSVTQATDIQKNEPMNVFVVPFSHVDPGWLKTFGDYFNETDDTLRLAVEFLHGHPEMRFMWAETSFLKHFWDHASEDTKQKMRQQVKSGQFDLVTGSWTMTDEANPYFWATIDNMIEGHQFLFQSFGIIPNVSWTNDPFGYSTAVPVIFQMAGIHQFIINRIHDSYKGAFRDSKNLEFLWRPLLSGIVRQDALTHTLPYSHYDILNSCGPSQSDCCEFDFKRMTHFSCPGPAPVKITKSNVEAKSSQLISQLRERQRLTRHPNVLFMLGDDFRYKDKQEWYQQYDNYKLLFDYINSRKEWNVKAKFGTITEYFSKLRGVRQKLATVRGDFFPYADNSYDYWTGYFTSRAYFKKLDRILQSHVRSADIFSNLALTSTKLHPSDARQLAAEYYSKLQIARKNLALFQHHDAITGTSQAHVMLDYGKRLVDSIKLADGVLASSLVILTTGSKKVVASEVKEEEQLIQKHSVGKHASWETRLIDLPDGAMEEVLLVNSLPYTRQEVIRLNVKNPHVLVVDKKTRSHIKAQLQPQFGFDHYVALYSYQLVFIVQLPPLSVKIIQLKGLSSLPALTSLANINLHVDSPRLEFPRIFSVHQQRESDAILKGSKYSTVHDSRTGFIKRYADSSGRSHDLTLSIWAYKRSGGGAYLFHPFKAPQPHCNRTNYVVLLSGSIVNEANTFCAGVWHRETFTLNSQGAMTVFVRNMVDIKAQRNFELIQRIGADIHNNNTFYTDEIGYQILRRNFYSKLSVEGNYYPIPSSAYIEDNSRRLTVLTSQPHGGTSPQNGVIELMLDRTLDNDDNRGMGEGVRDTVRTVSDFVITLEPRSASSDPPLPHKLTGSLSLLNTFHMQKLLYPVHIFHHKASKGFSYFNYQAIPRSLPCYVTLLSLRQLTNPGPSLLILHRSNVDCSFDTFDPNGSRQDSCSKGTVDGIYNLLVTLGTNKIIETSLSGVYDFTNIALRDMPQYLKPMNISAYKLYFQKFL